MDVYSTDIGWGNPTGSEVASSIGPEAIGESDEHAAANGVRRASGEPLSDRLIPDLE